MKIFGAVFQKTKIFIFFLIWTRPTLNFEGRSKKKETGNICKGTPDIEFVLDWSIGLGATLRDTQKIKNNFSSLDDFSGKADSVIVLGFECTINTQNLMKIVEAVFQKTKILYFFLMWTNPKKKKSRKYLQGDSRYRIWTRLVNWFMRISYVTDRKLKAIFLVSRIFPGKADSVILLGSITRCCNTKRSIFRFYQVLWLN